MTTCPDEPELLSVAAGEPTGDAIVQHVDACPACRPRVEQLRAELADLPPDLDGGLAADPARPGPAAHSEREPMDLFPMVSVPDPAGGWPERPVAIGRYLVIDLLDWGLEGDAHRVIHPNLGKEMVLKLGRRPVDGGDLVTEGRVLIELEHINLVKIYDSGIHDDRPYLAMEYVHGPNPEDRR